eukprot:SM000109S14156  [mRNA]  locus=s109:413409:415161:+ [translate_table: standard]
MAFKLLRSVLATIAHDIADDLKYILGRLFSRGGHSSFPFLIGNQQVNWENYNYPPFLRLIHYELNDVEDVHARRATFFAHLAFVVGVGSCLANLGGTIILALGGVHGKAVTIVYSTFNVVIFAVAGLYSFYMCYKGLVTTNLKFSIRYLFIQPIFICAFVAFSIVSGSNYNGWLNLAKSRVGRQPVSYSKLLSKFLLCR